ncbi:hypothetical protein LCGC14_1276090 [marine sediment metagenome]|uniref:Uncharacterized protein n=1 Tax=marine sediment metagenome TaxID=412755 RepID=A0A0F9NDA0_9ZZZZ
MSYIKETLGRIVNSPVYAILHLKASNGLKEYGDMRENIQQLEGKIEAAKELLGSQSAWCELANQECVGLKSIVYLVGKALKGGK